jgi:anti-sigma-K factor RskA
MTPDIHPHDDLAVYALDALEPQERASIDAHLVDCAACRGELDSYLATLGQMTVPEEPPDHVWEGISRQIRDGTTGAAGAADGARTTTAPGPAHLAKDASVTSLDQRRRPWESRGRVFAAAAAVLVVVALGAVAMASRPSTGTVAEQAADAADDADSTVVELTSLQGAPTARVVLTDDDDFVVFDDLPTLPSDRTYQLWRIDENVPVSLGVLGDGSDGAAKVTLPESAESLAISQEPAGGSDAPTDVVAS